MRIAIDAMGNDKGCPPIVEGVANYIRDFPDDVILLAGAEKRLEVELEKNSISSLLGSKILIANANDVVEMADKFDEIKQKKRLFNCKSG